MSNQEAERRSILRRMLWLLGLFFVLVQVNRSAGGVLANYLGAESGFSPTDIGAVMGAMFFASAVVQLPMGVMFDWLGPRRTLTYLSAIAVVGLAGGIGGMMATAPLELALGRFGLMATFLALAAATAAATLALHLTLRDRPPEAPGAAADPAESLLETVRGLIAVMRMRELWLIFAMGFCFAAPFYVILAGHARSFVPPRRAGRAIACINLVAASPACSACRPAPGR